MNALLKKMNFKEHKAVYVLNAPDYLTGIFSEWSHITSVDYDVPEHLKITDMLIVFVTELTEIEKFALLIERISPDDALVWFLYPKGSSKKYRCNFNRDSGWLPLGEKGFEGVRQIAFDEDWSALRFRRTRFIKTMTRSFAMSEEGKLKARK
jgi:hypothetical protein